MSMIVRTVVAIPFIVFLSLTAWFGWVLLDPLMASMLDVSDAPSAWNDGMFRMVQIGFLFVLPGLGVVILAWWVFGSIREDARFERRGGI